MNRYTHLFFDLDHTLWDTDRNAEESLRELFQEMELDKTGIPDFDAFHASYRTHNERLWGLYAENKVGRDAVRVHRFLHTLSDFGVDDQGLASQIADHFVARTPYRQHLIPGALSLLESLKGRFSLSIITNGFKEAQHVKLKSSGIDHFFDHIIISEVVGVHKPDPRIFYHAMEQAGVASAESCIMVGDTFQTDVCGAINAGITGVHFDPRGNQLHAAPIITIRKLEQLLDHL